MKKIIGIILAVILLVLCLAGCNRTMFDTTYKFDKAILSLPDGSVVSGEVEQWMDYDDGDQIQVKIGGKTYLVHAENVVLIAE